MSPPMSNDPSFSRIGKIPVAPIAELSLRLPLPSSERPESRSARPISDVAFTSDKSGSAVASDTGFTSDAGGSSKAF